jgi:hypothetical protein
VLDTYQGGREAQSWSWSPFIQSPPSSGTSVRLRAQAAERKQGTRLEEVVNRIEQAWKCEQNANKEFLENTKGRTCFEWLQETAPNQKVGQYVSNLVPVPGC